VIAVVDYKAGNLTSVMKALAAIGADAVATEDPAAVQRADKIILPGVGHFAATEFLDSRGLRQAIAERTAADAPFLGICVGLQWLFSGSTEAPECSGLGTFNATCERFTEGKKVPHVG
jgi:glutamine amidotransferase